MITIAASRKLVGRATCFVGIGLPSAAANLARLTHAPGVVLIYESGTIGSKPHVLPLSIGDGELAATADTVVSVPEIFSYWLRGGRIDVGFLGAAQIDKYARINTTVIGGSYSRPQVRLPGSGGAPEIATFAREVCLVVLQSRRSFVEKLDFITSSGIPDQSGDRPRGRSRGPTTVISDLGVMTTNSQTQELTLQSVHPGVTVEQVLKETGWSLRVAEEITCTASPSHRELEVLRDLQQRTRVAHERSGMI
jgi:glutaconate CoA-transferase subunit B